MKNFNSVKRRLRVLFVIATAIILLAAISIVMGVEFLLRGLGVITADNLENSWIFIFSMFGVASVIIGTAISTFVGKFVLSPVNDMIDGMEKLSLGKYDTRLDFGDSTTMAILSGSFNSLAAELERTEILRSDFINNFSHEFKTPIVSIKGLVGLMKGGRVTKEKQQQYLEIIEDESDRLAMMTTNILNLTKIEKQGIPVKKSVFNLSEQIRVCVLLDERRWSERHLSLQMDFDEFKVTADEDLLKQVWINLIDNAIKFTPDGGTLMIDISENKDKLSVKVGNTGTEISPSEREKVFHKFYQLGTSDSRAGNGIGLALVKNIVALHGGDITVTYENGMNVFTVVLPM